MNKIISCVLVIFILVFNSALVCSAVQDDILTQPTEQSFEIDDYLSNIKFSLIDQEVIGYSIQCFDVNESEMVAIGLNSIDENFVNVYNENCEFLYGYTFDIEGSFELEWNNDNLRIYFERSEIIVTFDELGKCVEVGGMVYSTDNSIYKIDNVYLTEKTIGDTTYSMKNDSFIFNILGSSYSKLVKIEENSNEIVIYDAGSMNTARNIVILLGLVFFCVIIIKMFINQIKGYNTNKNFN